MCEIHFYSVAYNRPDFIPIQLQSLKSNWVASNNCHYSFTVMINTKDEAMKQQLVDICIEYSVSYLLVPIKETELYNGGLTAYNYIRDHFFKKRKQNDFSVIMDADMFFYAPINIPELMEGYDVAAIYHQREKKRVGIHIYNYEYLWVGFMLFKHNNFDYSTMNFNPFKNICDVGGMTTFFLREQVKRGLRIKWLHHTANITKEYKAVFPNELWPYYSEEMGFQLIENAIIHYYRGSNWNGSKEKFMKSKDLFLHKFLDWAKTNNYHLPTTEHFDALAYSRKNFNGNEDNYNKKVRFSKKVLD